MQKLGRGIGVAKHVYCGGEGVEKVISDGIVIDEQNNGSARAISFFFAFLCRSMQNSSVFGEKMKKQGYIFLSLCELDDLYRRKTKQNGTISVQFKRV